MFGPLGPRQMDLACVKLGLLKPVHAAPINTYSPPTSSKFHLFPPNNNTQKWKTIIFRRLRRITPLQIADQNPSPITVTSYRRLQFLINHFSLSLSPFIEFELLLTDFCNSFQLLLLFNFLADWKKELELWIFGHRFWIAKGLDRYSFDRGQLRRESSRWISWGIWEKSHFSSLYY